jgi:hypothetical protein
MNGMRFVAAVLAGLLVQGVALSDPLNGSGSPYGVKGLNSSTSIEGYLGYGSYGVYGYDSNTTGTSRGVYGVNESDAGVGVYGRCNNASGTTYGCFGRIASTGGAGVLGYASAATGATRGVYGLNSSTSGVGVFGDATATTGSTHGVYGRVVSTAGYGVLGYATASSGATRGVYGLCDSSEGVGVLGDNTSATGTTYGLFGRVVSPDGYAGYFTGGMGVYVNGTLTATGLKFPTGAGDGRVALSDAQGNVSWGDPEEFVWMLGGNLGTTAGTHFLGTTDDEPLEIKVNNARVFRFEPQTTAPNLIGGYSDNAVTSGAQGGTISGGGRDTSENTVTDDFGTVGGGRNNTAGDGAGTASDRSSATVGGGSDNTASGAQSTVAGGNGNTASGERSAVLGGSGHNASGYAAAALGGQGNTASGGWSAAAGRRAKAHHDGGFVWADSTDDDVATSAANQFMVRASGGLYLYTNSTLTSGAFITPGGSAWSFISDRNRKTEFKAVDTKAVLEKLVAIPIQTWRYKSEWMGTRHMGPMAQDLHAAFGLGPDDTLISTVDGDGISMAAIQGLYRVVQEKDATIADLKKRVAEQEGELSDLKERMRQLESVLGGLLEK